MYLKIGAYKKNKGDPLACMTHGETAEILTALTAILSTVIERAMIDGLSEDEKKEARADCYEAIIKSLKRHENDERINY